MLNSWSQRLLWTRHPTSMKIFKSKSQILSEACNLFSSKCGKKGLVEKREKIDCTKTGKDSKDSKEDKNVIPKTHYDFPPPKFNYYRRDKLKNPKSRNKDSFEERRAFSYTMATAGLVGGLYAAKGLVNTFIKSMSATADVLAMAAIEVKLADIPEGKHVTMKWRGKPLFIWHRTPFLIEAARKVDISTLRDPQEDSERVQRPEWLVLIGVCTHLGCVPIAHSGDFHGYYCPCHGSHFDSAGRARKGPAPRNLEVPPYVFVGETLVVG